MGEVGSGLWPVPRQQGVGCNTSAPFCQLGAVDTERLAVLVPDDRLAILVDGAREDGLRAGSGA